MLIPFRKEHGEFVFRWQLDSEYKEFFRDIDRYLTIEECECLPKFMGREVLCYYEDSLVGLMVLSDHGSGVIEMGYLIDKNFQKKGSGLKMVTEAQEYMKNRRKARKAVGYVMFDNSRLRGLCAQNGFTEKCILKDHVYLNGSYKDVILIEKFL
jgi:RimJ/RimL family protein N-acetyltransferase